MQFDSPRADEFPFIFDSWARSFRKSPWAGCVPNHLYDQVSRATSAGIIDRGARVIVAVAPLPDGDRRVMGYAVSESEVLHWLFVKRDFRRMGVGRALLEETTRAWPRCSVFDEGHGPWKYTHKTRVSAVFLGAGWVWDPVPARMKT
jgi:GNAT superfamily N-acetyltransferase